MRRGNTRRVEPFAVELLLECGRRIQWLGTCFFSPSQHPGLLGPQKSQRLVQRERSLLNTRFGSHGAYTGLDLTQSKVHFVYLTLRTLLSRGFSMSLRVRGVRVTGRV